MAHGGQEPGLRQVGLFGAAAGFLGDRFCRFQFGDQVFAFGPAWQVPTSWKDESGWQ